MSLGTRAGLAMALAFAGGFGLPGPGAGGLASAASLGLLGLALVLGWWLAPNAAAPVEARRLDSSWLELLGLAALLAIVARTVGRIVIASPAALWSVPIVLLAPLALRRLPQRAVTVPVLIIAALAAGLVGARFEAAGPQARGRVHSSPILGVHPRQAVAVELDGFGPHDIILDDYVDPPGGQGYDPERWAARLEAELHAIAERNYADGPARARLAYASARVEVEPALVPPADRDLYIALLGVEVRSGTTGAGSTVEFVCPGQTRDPRIAANNRAVTRGCPRKYLIDGSAGLGLAPRFPGHTRVVGRDRVRLATALGWPSGDPRADRRALAVESGVWLVVIVLMTLLTSLRGARPTDGSTGSTGSTGSVLLIVIGLVVLLGLTLAGDPRSSLGSTDTQGGPTLLALLLILAPTPRSGKREALPFALLVVLLALSPIAGRDALEVFELARDRLAGLGLEWATAGGLAGALAVVVLAAGAGICATALVDRSGAMVRDQTRERRHMRAGLLALALPLALAVGLALRKPTDDLALLGGAAALVLLAAIPAPSRARQLALGVLWSVAALAPVLIGAVRGPLASVVLGLVGLACLVVGLRTRPTTPDPGSAS